MPIAFFDMDKTLLRKASGTEFVKYLTKRGMVTPRELFQVGVIAIQYRTNTLDFPTAMTRLSQRVKGGDAVAMKTLCDKWVADELIHTVAPKALARAREHEQRGDEVIILSASTQFAVGPVASALGLSYRCTELEIAGRHFTGNTVGEPCYGEGKLIWARRLADAKQVALNACTFYTDSYSDRALMEAVGHPIAVNPDRKLRELARNKSWPVEIFY